jgi:hypothetical protein
VTGITGLQSGLGGADNLMRWGAGIALDYYREHADTALDADSLRANALGAMKGPANLGTDVHAQAANWLTDVDVTLNGQTDSFLVQFGRFLWKERPEPLYVEEAIFNLTVGYGGTFDLFARLRGSTALVDIKTGKPKDEHRLQLVGYDEAEFIARSGTAEKIEMPKADKFYVLSLKPDGYELIEQKITKADRQHFRELAAFYHKMKAWNKKGGEVD